MKRHIKTGAFAVLVFCSNWVFAQVKTVKNAPLDMRGAYTMQKQELDSGTGAWATGIQQKKIYTDKYIMYAHRMSGTDSLAEFGIGTYKVENGKVIESIFYIQAGPGNNTFELAITNAPGCDQQVIDFAANNKHYLLTEDYQQAKKSTASPLDGAWKRTKVVTTGKTGKVTTTHSLEFKLLESGNFIWAQPYKNEKTGKDEAVYGYGTFAINGQNQAIENVTSTSFSTALVGHSITLNLNFLTRDTFEQTIVWPTGDKIVETYERLQ